MHDVGVSIEVIDINEKLACLFLELRIGFAKIIVESYKTKLQCPSVKLEQFDTFHFGCEKTPVWNWE
jgi:hypothetical protein